MKTKMKPILFSATMVQAILEGRKTQTRRILKPQPTDFIDDDLREVNPVPCIKKGDTLFEAVPQNVFSEDILWVRETWQQSYNEKADKWDFIFRADGGVWFDDDGPVKWKPSIFMPKEACRIFLKVINVRVERLDNISKEDAIAEGIGITEDVLNNDILFIDYRYNNHCFTDPVGSFFTLWESINGVGSWKKNPWVWVYEFERIKKPEVWP